ncbi:MAG: GNAT family N-acetyltransferase, partial [Gemmatimonadota bacterium]
HYELPLAGTRRGLRRMILDRLQRSLVVVARLDDRIVGALWVEVRSRRYWIATAVTVLPAYRRRGVAWDLANRVLAICGAAGMGIVGVIAETNPIDPREPADTIGSWRYLTLVPPRRFRGHARLRQIYERLDELTQRTPEHVRPDA